MAGRIRGIQLDRPAAVCHRLTIPALVSKNRAGGKSHDAGQRIDVHGALAVVRRVVTPALLSQKCRIGVECRRIVRIQPNCVTVAFTA